MLILKYNLPPGYLSKEDIEEVGLQFKETIDRESSSKRLERFGDGYVPENETKLSANTGLGTIHRDRADWQHQSDLINTSQMAENFRKNR